MNFDNVNKWFSLIANIGVLAGVIFVGFEIQQNNSFLEAESRFNHSQARSGIAQTTASDGELAEIRYKWLNDQPLSEIEEYRIRTLYRSMFTLWEWEFGEGVRGRLDPPVEAWRRTLRNCQTLSIWNRAEGTFDEEFEAFVNEAVVGECQ